MRVKLLLFLHLLVYELVRMQQLYDYISRYAVNISYSAIKKVATFFLQLFHPGNKLPFESVPEDAAADECKPRPSYLASVH